MEPDRPVEAPLPDDTHDVVLLPKVGGVEKFPVDRTTGRYTARPVSYTRNQSGGRKARAVVDPSNRFGPALAIAPTRPEPAAQNGTCVLVNQHNVRIRNPWTTARLNNEPRPAESPNDDPFNAPLPASDNTDGFELVVAGTQGKLYLVKKLPRKDPTVAEIRDVGLEGEIWYQLRGGLVAGSAQCFQEGRVIPVVNVTSLRKE